MSQAGEDVLLLAYYFCVDPPDDPTFLEIGAFDGKKLSNSYLYEYRLGWNGLLVEAAPALYDMLHNNRDRGRSTIVTMAVCPYGPNGEIRTLKFAGKQGVSGVIDDMSDAHRQQWAISNNTVDVPCKPITDMIRHDAKLDHIDVFSLDVEGGELSVLKTFDFTIPVCIFVVELDNTDPVKDEGVRNILRANGFQKVLRDSIFHCYAIRGTNDCLILNEYWRNSHHCRYTPDRLRLTQHDLDEIKEME